MSPKSASLLVSSQIKKKNLQIEFISKIVDFDTEIPVNFENTGHFSRILSFTPLPLEQSEKRHFGEEIFPNLIYGSPLKTSENS